MKYMIAYLIDRLSEPSTLRGFIQALIIGLGATVPEASLEMVVTIAVSISAIMKVMLPDNWRKAPDPATVAKENAELIEKVSKEVAESKEAK